MKHLFFLFFLPFFMCNAQTEQQLEIGTFNIRFFPCNQDGELMKKYNINMRRPPQGPVTDTTALFNLLEELDIEVLGLQELVDPVLFGEMAKRHLGDKYDFIYAPSTAWQKVGILYDASLLELKGSAQIYPEVALGRMDRHRPALRAYFKVKPNGFDFHVIVVHLKASPWGYKERVKQWKTLQTILSDIPDGPQKDADIILLGDFNNVSKHRYQEFLPIIENKKFFWVNAENDTLITSYWQPDKNVKRLQSSSIDQIFISNDAVFEYVKNSVNVGALCNGLRQEITGKFPDFYQNISDHCPVFGTFKTLPDND